MSRLSGQQVVAVRGKDTHQFVIADSASESTNYLDFTAYVTGLIFIPASFTGYLAFKQSLSEGGVFVQVYDKASLAIYVDASTLSADAWVEINPALMSSRYLTVQRFSDAALTTPLTSGDLNFDVVVTS